MLLSLRSNEQIGGKFVKENLKFAWIASWFALVGQLMIFTIISIITGEWRYLMWSFMAAMIAGVPSIIHTWQAQKKADMQDKEDERNL